MILLTTSLSQSNTTMKKSLLQPSLQLQPFRKDAFSSTALLKIPLLRGLDKLKSRKEF